MKARVFVISFTLLLIFSIYPSNIAQAYSNEDLRILTKSSYDLINLSAARDLGLTGKDQVVVFIDDGIEIDHPYIKNNVLDGFCSSEVACGTLHLKSGKEAGGIFPKTSSSPHGNMVAGIIAGEVNSVALGGIAPGAKLISITNTDGNFPGLEAAFNWILEAKKKYNIVAVSGSFGSTNLGERSEILGCTDSELNGKIKALADVGIVPVFSAGNDSNIVKMSHPACLPFVVSVGALNFKGQLQDYSNVGGNLTVLAPSDVMTASRNGGYMLGGGTSAAGPVVAGVVALLKEAKPSATVEEIKKALQTTDKYLNDAYWTGIPVLNVYSAVNALKTGQYVNSPLSTQLDGQKRIDASVRVAEEAMKAQVKAEEEAKLAKLAQVKAESDAKLANDAQKKMGEDLGVLVEHKAGCHGLPSLTGELAEVEAKQNDGTWKKVSTYTSWEIAKDCPPTNPTRWWAIIDAGETEILRWKFWIGLNAPFYPAEISFVNSVKQLKTKTEADAKLAKDAQVKAEADLKTSQAVVAQIQQDTAKLRSEFETIRMQLSELAASSSLVQKENASLKKKLTAICKVKPKPKGC